MQISKLPDGTWASSAFYMGFGGLKTPCQDDAHQWETEPASKIPIPAEKTERPDGVTHTVCQVCKKCTYRRLVLIKEAS